MGSAWVLGVSYRYSVIVVAAVVIVIVIGIVIAISSYSETFAENGGDLRRL